MQDICGRIKIKRGNPYKFLELLKSNNNTIELEYIKRNYPEWIHKLERWREHFIDWIVDDTRHWITIKNGIITLEISLTPPKGWKERGGWGKQGYTGLLKCYHQDGTPRSEKFSDLNLKYNKNSAHSSLNRTTSRKQIEDTHLLPSEIRNIYNDIYNVLLGKSNIFAGTGIRTLIESVCKNKKARGNTLKDKIDDLVKRGTLAPKIADTLHKARLLGNESVHVTVIPSNHDLDIAMDIVEHFIKDVYIIPQKASYLSKPKKKVTIKLKTNKNQKTL